MGTRGLTKVIRGGETVVAQYGQWDHYPSGQGVTALNFLSKTSNIAKLIVGLANVYYPTQEDLEVLIKPYLNDNGMMFIEDGDKWTNDYPSLTRDTGAGILEVIATAKGKVPIKLDVEFEDDDLFCEGVFTVDLDNHTFRTKCGDIDLTLTLDECASITREGYLEKASCPVYEYEKSGLI